MRTSGSRMAPTIHALPASAPGTRIAPLSHTTRSAPACPAGCMHRAATKQQPCGLRQAAVCTMPQQSSSLSCRLCAPCRNRAAAVRSATSSCQHGPVLRMCTTGCHTRGVQRNRAHTRATRAQTRKTRMRTRATRTRTSAHVRNVHARICTRWWLYCRPRVQMPHTLHGRTDSAGLPISWQRPASCRAAGLVLRCLCLHAARSWTALCMCTLVLHSLSTRMGSCSTKFCAPQAPPSNPARNSALQSCHLSFAFILAALRTPAACSCTLTRICRANPSFESQPAHPRCLPRPLCGKSIQSAAHPKWPPKLWSMRK